MIVAVLILTAGAVVILENSTLRVVAAYMVIVATVGVIAAPATVPALLPLAFFWAAFALKLVLAPAVIGTFVRRNPPARDLRPVASLPLRLIAVLAMGFGAQYVHIPGLAASSLSTLAAYIVLVGLAELVLDRNLLAQVVGLLVLSTGVTLAGVACAPQLPAAVELGAAFDVLVVTFIGLALVRALLTDNPLLDIESLRRLRG